MQYQIYLKLIYCHLEARKKKRGTKNEYEFEVDLFENLFHLAEEIANFTYTPSPGIAFVTRKPVIREIFAAPYRDRIVHHLIFSIVEPYWEKRFIDYSCSCRKNKGTSFGVEVVEKSIRKATKNYQEPAEVYKFDLSGYFMSLSRGKLYQKAIQGLDEQFAGRKNHPDYRMVKYLWRKVIMNDATVGVKIRGKIKDWEDLPKNKSLFCQPRGRGIVIGNLTSQLLSNIFLNDFDHLMQQIHPHCFYIRYVDDFMIIGNRKYAEKIKAAQPFWQEELRKLGLRINDKKTYHQTVDKGISFLGTTVFPYRTVIGKRLKKNMNLAAKRYRNGEIGIDSIVSYTGFTVHHDSYKMTLEFLKKCGLL